MNKEFIIQQMKHIFQEEPLGVTHSLNVLQNACDIMDGECVTSEEKNRIELTAILHDVGIPQAKTRYGTSESIYQEKEGPPIARKILMAADVPKREIDRICHIIGYHHTPSQIDGLDFQILWEADLMEYLKVMDPEEDFSQLKMCIDGSFKTRTGKALAYERFLTPGRKKSQNQ